MHLEICRCQHGKQALEHLKMLFPGVGADEHIVDEDSAVLSEAGAANFKLHDALKPGRGLLQAEHHLLRPVELIAPPEGCKVAAVFCQRDLIEPRSEVQPRENLGCAQRSKELLSQRVARMHRLRTRVLALVVVTHTMNYRASVRGVFLAW